MRMVRFCTSAMPLWNDDDLALGVVVHGIDAGSRAVRHHLVGRPRRCRAAGVFRGVYGVLHAFQSAAAGFFVAADLFGAGSIQLARKVETSMISCSAPAHTPHAINAKAPPDDEGARRKRYLTCSGVALVATSKVFGVRPTSKSAYCAAYDVGIKACLLEGAYYVCARSSTSCLMRWMLAGISVRLPEAARCLVFAA